MPPAGRGRPVAIERGRVQRDHVVAFLDRGKPGIDVAALGFETPDVAGQGGRVDAGLDDGFDRGPQFPADRGLAAFQFAALVGGDVCGNEALCFWPQTALSND